MELNVKQWILTIALVIVAGVFFSLILMPGRCQFHLHFMQSFYSHRSQKCKKYYSQFLTVFFVCFGSACVKDSRKMLIKSTIGVNSPTFYKQLFHTKDFAQLSYCLVIFLVKEYWQKVAPKMLLKLTN